MKTKIILPILLLSCFIGRLLAQPVIERDKPLGEVFISQFGSAPFPHPKRMDGHIYKNELFAFQEHYADSSVLIFVPKGFNPNEAANFVVYFHGWRNNLDSASAQFKLIEQFSESRKNAIFIFPEGPKNSPDSFGGKLEDENGLKNLLTDVSNYLAGKKVVKTREIGKIILAGHSGAYRAIAFSLAVGGLTKNISDVILFDALYGETDKIENWIKNFNGRFINIYTDNGGTKEESEILMQSLDSTNTSYLRGEDGSLKADDLSNNRLIFIHTDLTHNEVVSTREQFLKYLRSSGLSVIDQ